MFDVICVGQAVIDCIIKGKETSPFKENVYRADQISLHTGGDAVNEAIALAQLGANVALLCGVGEDLAGNLILQEAQKKGIDTSLVTIGQNETPIANIQVSKDGSRFSINSHATRLEGYQIDCALPNAKILSLASLFRPPLEDVESLKELVKQAKSQNSIICADTKLPLVDAISLEAYQEVLKEIDYIFPNEKEAQYYSKKETYQEMADVFHAYGVKHVIIKCGEKGCYVSGDGRKELIPAVPVARIVDSTGAGDNFVAGFLMGLLQEEKIQNCIERALKQADFSLQHRGACV
ncbi:MAG: carbohydrate kinase family protein [Solobacterium sp.]|nr:carbohydrate kinase family protein [Solobacterium sp.]